jgi:hypothetical protein
LLNGFSPDQIWGVRDETNYVAPRAGAWIETQKTAANAGFFYLPEYFIIIDFFPPNGLKEKKLSNPRTQ